MGQENCHPKPGDLIEIDRPFHQHWALYLGDGYVINLTPAGRREKNLSQERSVVATVLDVLEFMRRVKKQLLKEVVGNNKWRVNNKCDQYCSPLPVEEIIRRAEGYIDKEVIYSVFGSNCERFVTMLRYGGQLRDFIHGELHIPERAHGMRYPDPGDLIQIKWPNHHHWALYMGDGYVIHVTSVDENVPPVSASTETIFTGMVKVKKELLRKVVGNDDWRVNNKYDWYCTPLPVEEIIWRAEGYIDKEVPYEEFGRKCERFVKRLRYVGQLRDFVHGELHIPEMAHGMRYPDPGDLIEIKWPNHHHWALYMGDGYVIHVTSVDEDVPPVSASTETIFTGKAKVKKELLRKVVGNAEWRVYNKYDWYHTPLPVEQIIQRAEGDIDKEVPNCFFHNNCGRFVEKLRYGDQLSNFVRAKMDIPEMAHGMRYPDPGDLIEFKWKRYQHWALYVGKGYVIHVTDVDENVPPVSASTETIPTRKVKVQKELLTNLARHGEWRVNKEHDCCNNPPVEEIIWRAEGYIGKELPYDVFGSKCGHFVKSLRYGGHVVNCTCGEMHTPTIAMRCHERAHGMHYPNPGDLIEIDRPLWQHWALYMGKGYVIHVTATGENSPALSASTVTIFTRKAKVKKELLTKVVENNKWYVNNKYDLRRCPYPVEEILWRAEQWIDKEVPYRLFQSNCEHFVTMLRYGDAVSGQVLNAYRYFTPLSGAAGLGLLGVFSLATSPVLVAASGVGLLANIGLLSSTNRHISICCKFWRQQYDAIEKMCC